MKTVTHEKGFGLIPLVLLIVVIVLLYSLGSKIWEGDNDLRVEYTKLNKDHWAMMKKMDPTKKCDYRLSLTDCYDVVRRK